MINASYNTKLFMEQMNNAMEYSLGFLDGIQKGKRGFLDNLGRSTVEAMKQFIDSMARVDPGMLQHVYEWSQSGSPSARLYDIDYTVSNVGLSFRSSFRQSTSVKAGSKTPFYDKARIMESGIPVRIKPRLVKVLAFNDNGEQVFTSKEILVSDPGGPEAQGGLERALDIFINQYFRQSFLNSSGIINYLNDVSIYKKNFSAGSRQGKSKGTDVGYRWIINAGVAL
jgi:hypothetical protein